MEVGRDQSAGVDHEAGSQGGVLPGGIPHRDQHDPLLDQLDDLGRAERHVGIGRSPVQGRRNVRRTGASLSATRRPGVRRCCRLSQDWLRDRLRRGWVCPGRELLTGDGLQGARGARARELRFFIAGRENQVTQDGNQQHGCGRPAGCVPDPGGSAPPRGRLAGGLGPLARDGLRRRSRNRRQVDGGFGQRGGGKQVVERRGTRRDRRTQTELISRLRGPPRSLDRSLRPLGRRRGGLAHRL